MANSAEKICEIRITRDSVLVVLHRLSEYQGHELIGNNWRAPFIRVRCRRETLDRLVCEGLFASGMEKEWNRFFRV